MPDIAQGNNAKLILEPGEVYRVSAAGTASVQAVYGAPSGTTTVTASSRDFGPYDAHAKLIVTATSGPVNYQLRQGMSPVLVDDNNRLLTPDGGVVGRDSFRHFTHRLFNAPALGAFDTTSFRVIRWMPHVGKKLVRARYENDTTSAWGGTMATALSAGRAFADHNPINAAGAAAAWSLHTGLAVPAGDANLATNGKWGVAYTPYMLVDFPPAIDQAEGSYLYAGMKLSAGTGRGLVRNAGQPFEEWETVLGTSIRQRARAFYQVGGQDFVTANQNGMTAPVTGAFYCPALQFEVLDAANALSILSVGDSTRGGQSTTGFAWNFMNQWADSRSSLARPISCSNLGFAGKAGAFYLGFLEQMLTDGSAIPDCVGIQPFSANSASEGAIQSDLAKAFSLAEAYEAKGSTVYFTTVGPAVNWFSASSANEAVRLYGNAMIRASGRPVIDLDAVVSDGASPIAAIKPGYTPDGNHYNNAANADIANIAVAPVMRRLFGI